MSGNKHTVFIHQHRVYKAKLGNAGGDLRHLCVRMRARGWQYGSAHPASGIQYSDCPGGNLD